MNLNYSELCTVFIVTYYSQNKIKSCLDSIPRKYNVIIFDNSGQSDYKKEIDELREAFNKKVLEDNKLEDDSNTSIVTPDGFLETKK